MALILAFCAGLLAMALPLASGIWWVFDLASHARLQTILGFAALAILACGTRRWRIGFAAIVMSLVHGIALWPYYASNPSAVENSNAAEFRLIMANLLTTNQEHSSFLRWARKVNPDVMVLQEVGKDWHHFLSQNLQAWPHSESWVREDHLGLAVYSRIPFEALEWKELYEEGPPRLLVRFPWEGQSIPLYTTHAMAPVARWAAEARDAQFKRLAQEAWVGEGTALLAGDFNATPWSVALRPPGKHPLTRQPPWVRLPGNLARTVASSSPNSHRPRLGRPGLEGDPLEGGSTHS